MPLSVMNSPGGGAMSNLLRQTRPVKSGDETGSAAANETTTAVAARPGGRGAIDSTGSGTAGIKAALTLYLSPLGGQADAAAEKTQARAVPAGTTPAASRTGASDLLRVLDAYAAEALRLSA